MSARHSERPQKGRR
nr:hypothetical protein [Tanacetum cinerariifolium]